MFYTITQNQRTNKMPSRNDAATEVLPNYFSSFQSILFQYSFRTVVCSLISVLIATAVFAITDDTLVIFGNILLLAFGCISLISSWLDKELAEYRNAVNHESSGWNGYLNTVPSVSLKSKL